MSAAVCGNGSSHNLRSPDVGLFLKVVDEEDDLRYHCNSLIKSDSITATAAP